MALAAHVTSSCDHPWVPNLRTFLIAPLSKMHPELVNITTQSADLDHKRIEVPGVHYARNIQTEVAAPCEPQSTDGPLQKATMVQAAL